MTKNKDKKQLFADAWSQYAPADIALQGEYHFAAMTCGGTGPGVRARLAIAFLKDWRFDFIVPGTKIAIEIDGGNRMVRRTASGRHVAVGAHTQDDDYWKLNHAARFGWRVFRFSVSMVKKYPKECVRVVLKAVA